MAVVPAIPLVPPAAIPELRMIGVPAIIVGAGYDGSVEIDVAAIDRIAAIAVVVVVVVGTGARGIKTFIVVVSGCRTADANAHADRTNTDADMNLGGCRHRER
jgi:hypothetical protein